ncbi:hypothetical protein CVIRNUC_009062 [Coccomyxa viridis]|uniref:SEA domain-containing protein n=1 Tax=Coccomyxa viridis TaxID=1274662 RepID=A0AAV1II08_9CHLO|nr:hypothetical protein CVIRNUC_009062 [Coccomyxa viridis]
MSARPVTFKQAPQQPALQSQSPPSPSAPPKSPAAPKSPPPSPPAAVPPTRQKGVLQSVPSPTAASPAARRSPGSPKVPPSVTPLATPPAGQQLLIHPTHRPAGPPQAAKKATAPAASVAVPPASPKSAGNSSTTAMPTVSPAALPKPPLLPALPPAASAALRAGQFPADLSLRLAAAASTVAAGTAVARRMQSSSLLQPNVSMGSAGLSPSGAVPPVQAQAPSRAKLHVTAVTVPSPAELAKVQMKQEARENMKAAYTMVARINGFAPPPQEPLSTTPGQPLPGAPAIPVNITSKNSKSAVSVAMRVSGAGVSPFTLEKQRQLINVFADATGNISVSQFSILLVSSAFSSRHRSLLQAATVGQGSTGAVPLQNVVDVTMEVGAGTPGNAQAVRDQLAALITGGTYLDVALQRAGLEAWRIKLLTISIVQPSQSSNQMPCQKRFGRWCLDKTGLSVPLVIIIIAFGSAVLVFVAILILVIREVRKHSGETAVLEYPRNDSITTKTHILTYVIGQDASPAKT